MTISLNDLLAMSSAERERALRRLAPSTPLLCGSCHQPISDEHPEEMRHISGKPVHEDCYYEDLGNLMEQHPPGHAGIRRA
jgi:hypothetical protein